MVGVAQVPSTEARVQLTAHPNLRRRPELEQAAVVDFATYAERRGARAAAALQNAKNSDRVVRAHGVRTV